MATTQLISVAEYLQTTYRPDCDYIDGEVQERNLGEQDHSDLQMKLIELLRLPANKLHVRVNPEIRVQVNAERFRVPDVCVRSVRAPSEQIVRHAPLVCVEIFSPRDTVAILEERVVDYLAMGVPEVWLVHPATRKVTVYTGFTVVDRLEGELSIPGTPVVLAIADVFGVLDEY